MVGFWFLEVTSLLYIVMTLNFFISGQMLPLDLLPQPWSAILKALAVPVHGLFPGGGLPGQGEGRWTWPVGLLAELPGRSSSCCWRGGSTGSACGATAHTGGDADGTVRLADTSGSSASLARYTLRRELAFRGNFLVKVSVEVLWLGDPAGLLPRRSSPRRRRSPAGPRTQYLFFVGCFFALNGLIETLFLENCNEFAELVRTGDLDFLLLRPIDEQFLITCRRIDWATAPNVLMGAAVMVVSLWQMHWEFDPVRRAGVPGDVRLRHGDRLQLHAAADVALGLDGPEPEPDGDVVALLEPGALPQGDLRRAPGPSRWASSSRSSCRSCWSSNVPADAMVRVLDPRMVGFTLRGDRGPALGSAGGSSSTP